MQESKTSKQFVSKVCYVFLSLTLAFVVALIFWTTQSNQKDDFADTQPFRNSNPETLETLESVCLVEALLGDGFCDDEANTSECDYDLEDCCQMASDRNHCTNCTCFVSPTKFELYQEQNCQNYVQTNFLGDGICDLSNNVPEHFFDIGDCCIEEHKVKCSLNSFFGFTSFTFCPNDNPCIKSNNYCIADQLGDGICQDHNNGPYCDYDMGDCCNPSVDLEQCCSCSCHTFDFLWFSNPSLSAHLL